MAGILYGVGVGPGDPELLTLKAVRIMNESDILIVPGDKPEKSVAYQIASSVIDLSAKSVIAVAMPMTKDKKRLEQAHQEASIKIMDALKEKQASSIFNAWRSLYLFHLYLYT